MPAALHSFDTDADAGTFSAPSMVDGDRERDKVESGVTAADAIRVWRQHDTATSMLDDATSLEIRAMALWWRIETISMQRISAASRDLPTTTRATLSNDKAGGLSLLLRHWLPCRMPLSTFDRKMDADNDLGGGVLQINTLGQLAPSSNATTSARVFDSDTSIPFT